MSLPAEFHDIAKRVNNWGRWGADDEIGTLNLITDEVVREAAATVRTGRRVPLALPLQQDGVQTGMIPGRVNPLHTMVQINQEIFGPGTVAYQRRRRDHGPPGRHPLGRADPCLALRQALQRPPRRHHHRRTAAPSSAASTRRGTSSRAGCCSTWRARGACDRLPGGHAVTPEDLEAAEELAGTRVRAGDIVLVRTGQIQVYLGGRQARRTRYPSPGPVGPHPGVVPRARCRGGRQRHPDLRDLPAGDRGPVAARARPRPGRDGDAAGPELESGRVVHSLWTRGPVRVPAVGDARAVRRRHRHPGGTGGRSSDIEASAGRPRRRAESRPPSTASRAGRPSTPAHPGTLAAAPTDPHSSRAPVTEPSSSPRGESLNTSVINGHATSTPDRRFMTYSPRRHRATNRTIPACHRPVTCNTGSGRGRAPDCGACARCHAAVGRGHAPRDAEASTRTAPSAPARAGRSGPPRTRCACRRPRGCQPQRSASPSTSSRPRPLVSSPSACRGAAARALASATSSRTVPRPPATAARRSSSRSTAGQPVCTTALVTSSEMSRISVSASGSSSPIPDPASRERAHLPGSPHLRGVGPDLQLHLKHLHRSHHPNRRTHRLAPPGPRSCHFAARQGHGT